MKTRRRMEKNGITTLLILSLLVSMLSITFIPSAIAHTEEAPNVTDLVAGQGIDVGDVLVWNDCDNLYVKYVTTDDWCLTETHLAVASSLTEIPTTKKNNPIPGQFCYHAYHDCVTEYLYSIPLEWPVDAEVVIAAHAEVVHIIYDECIDVVSDTSVQWSPDGSTWSSTYACWVHPNWKNIPGATWIWRTEYTDPLWEYNNVPDGGWWFRKAVTIPSSAFDIEASMVAGNGDNAYRIAINSISLVPDGEGAMSKDGPDNQEWSTVVNHGIPGDTIVPGYNEIQLRALNYFSWGDASSNPAGLIFKMCLCYDYFDMMETAWADGVQFEGANWATYFTYKVQGWNVEGDWVIRVFYGGIYDHDFTFSAVQSGGQFTGSGGYPATGPPYIYTETVTGTVTGNSIDFKSVYDTGYWWHAVGTIAPDGTMSGTWTSSTGQTGGTWESIDGQAKWE